MNVEARFFLCPQLKATEGTVYEQRHVIPTMWYFDECRLRRACAATS